MAAKKWAQSTHPKVPSFIYRQDGHELSYEINAMMIPQFRTLVKIFSANCSVASKNAIIGIEIRNHS